MSWHTHFPPLYKVLMSRLHMALGSKTKVVTMKAFQIYAEIYLYYQMPMKCVDHRIVLKLQMLNTSAANELKVQKTHTRGLFFTVGLTAVETDVKSSCVLELERTCKCRVEV